MVFRLPRYIDLLNNILMETSDLRRHRIIKNLTAQPTENSVHASIVLWEQMSTQLISIVGVGGFNSLFARSVFLAQSAFPWLAIDILSPPTDQRFAELKMRLEGRPPAEAGAANSLLLITFTDILAALIGEQLTISILCSAWGDKASDRRDKEFDND